MEDEGRGIPVDELALVMQRFYRGREQHHNGSGLGLAIAEAALAHLRESKVELRNMEGGGLRATVSLLNTARQQSSHQ
ncbi:ATP-binding protein [Bosea sp. TAF32]|uniref:ATP-binding protein n=1 Tax=Bosea sp. TAF32 TaxID=3237482 RepID=UPI003F9061A6